MQPSTSHAQPSPLTIAAQLLSVPSTDTARIPRRRFSEPDALEATIAEDAGLTAPGAQDGVQRHHRIAERAHDLFVARGMAHGSDVEDWLEAERQVDTEGGVDEL